MALAGHQATSSISEGDAILMQILRDCGHDVDFTFFSQPAAAVKPQQVSALALEQNVVQIHQFAWISYSLPGLSLSNVALCRYCYMGFEQVLEGVEHMHPTTYFRHFWAECIPVMELFESLEAARQAAADERSTPAKDSQYPAHLGASALDTALSSGDVLQVSLLTRLFYACKRAFALPKFKPLPGFVHRLTHDWSQTLSQRLQCSS